MTVKCFSMSYVVNYNDGVTQDHGPFHFRRSSWVRDELKSLLKNVTISSLVITIVREERDPVENTAS